jgi:hypothetical protein
VVAMLMLCAMAIAPSGASAHDRRERDKLNEPLLQAESNSANRLSTCDRIAHRSRLQRHEVGLSRPGEWPRTCSTGTTLNFGWASRFAHRPRSIGMRAIRVSVPNILKPFQFEASFAALLRARLEFVVVSKFGKRKRAIISI